MKNLKKFVGGSLLLAVIGFCSWAYMDAAKHVRNQTAKINVETKTTDAVVEAKLAIPAHSYSRWVGKFSANEYYPESYELHFKISGMNTKFEVGKKFYDKVNAGDKVQVDYVYWNGRNEPTKVRMPDDQ